jgi:hypothetical protein
LLLCSGRVSPVRGYSSLPLAVRGGSFTVPGCRADQVTRAYFLDPVAKLGGVIDGTPGVAVPTIKLAECGRIRFLVVGPAGQPRAEQEVAVTLLLERDRPTSDPHAEPIADAQPVEWFDAVNYRTRAKTNAEGLVELPALIPGARYAITVGSGQTRVPVGEFTIESGRTVTVKDVVLPEPLPAASGRSTR